MRGPAAGGASRVACLLLLGLVPTSLAAQQRLARFYDQQQGLPAPSITALAQDAAGFLWIGTVAGLIRYDGNDMRAWGRADVSGAIREAQARGRLVVVRDERDAVYTVRPAGLAPLPGPDTRPVIGAVGLSIDEEGVLWVAWPGRLARRTLEGEWQEVAPPPLTRGETLRLVRASRGQVLVASTARVWRLRAEGRYQLIFEVPNPADLLIRGADDYVVVGQAGSTLRLLQRYAGSTDVLLELRERRPMALAERGGALWVAYDRGSAILRPSEPPELLEADRGLPGGGPLLVDREGSVWLGSFNGLTQFPEPETVIWTEAHGLPSSHARYVSVIGGDVWTSTWGGLGRVPLSARTGRARDEGLGVVERVCRLAEGDHLASDTRGRWFRLSGGAWSALPWPSGPIVVDCHASRSGFTWLATSRGLYRAAGTGAPPERVASPDSALTAVHEDSAGGLWTGAGDRICRRPGGRGEAGEWTCTSLAGAGEVLDFIDVPGGLWAATRAGVWVNRGSGWRVISSSLGLPSHLFYGFATSPSGGIWVLSAGAVIRVVPDPAPAETWRVLERLSAWQGVQTEEGSGLVELTDGTVWLASAVGLSRIPITARRIQREPPLVEISNVLVNGLEVQLEDRQRLGAPDAVVELRFAVLTYRDRSRLLTQLQLSPERPWSPAGTGVPTFRLSQLTPGRYAAAVRASIDGERWSRPSTPVTFVVPAPWYRRPSILLLAALAAATVLVLLHRARTAVLLGLERQRTAIAMDLHDELGAGLGSIGILAGVAARPEVSEGERRDFSQRIASTAAELGGKLTDIVGALRSGRTTLPVFAADLAERAARLVPGPVPELRTEYPDQWPEVNLDAAVRHDLRLIALEAVHNAVRHAAPATITVGLAPAGRHWRLWVRDDGCGFEPEGDAPPRGGGVGQRALRRRAERLRAILRVDSAPGKGTLVEVEFEPQRARMIM